MEKVGVKRIAELARITLSEEEIAKFETQVSEIVEYNALQLSKVEDLPENVVEPRSPSDWLGRPDESQPSLSQEDAIANASEVQNGFVVVPKVLE